MKKHLWLLLVSFGFIGCGEESSTTEESEGVSFTDAAREMGVDYRITHGGCGKRRFIEISAGGCALLDYDDDGWLDIYLINGAPLDGTRDPVVPNAMYRNLGNGRFEDVTAATGTGDKGYGFGCAVGDIDGDGDVDLFVTNFGADRLYRNRGDGTFEDATEASGLEGELWSTSAGFFDYDKDEDLDLYVCHYVNYDLASPPLCVTPKGQEEYCNPGDFDGVQDKLYRNRGDGTFEDVTDQAGIDDREGRGYGVTFGDYDSDGDLDIYVANDQNRNNLYRNEGDGTFTDIGLYCGAGFGDSGRAEAGMGCDFGDIDFDLDLDIIVTNFSDETNSLYVYHEDDLFVDETLSRGLGEPTSFPLAFGTGFFDYDQDSDLDVFFACGHVLDTISRYGKGETWAQKNLLLENRDGAFHDVSASSGEAFSLERVGRGAAFGDLDNDGDVDIVVTSIEAEVAIYLNGANRPNQAFLLDLRSARGAPDIGARAIADIGERRVLREVHGAYSFQNHNDLRLHFGLGGHSQASSVLVRWSDGTEETLGALDGGQVVQVVQGKGIVKRTPLSVSP